MHGGRPNHRRGSVRGMDDPKTMRDDVMRKLYAGALKEANERGVNLADASEGDLRVYSVELRVAAAMHGWAMGTMDFVAESLKTRGLLQLFVHGQLLMALTPIGFEYARRL